MINKRFFLASALLVPALSLAIIAGNANAATPPDAATNTAQTVQGMRPGHRGFPGMRGGMMGKHMGKQMGKKMQGPRGEAMKAVQDAIEKNDFNAFKTASKDHPHFADIDEAKFAKLVRAHQLMKEAHTLMQEVHGKK